MKEIDVLLATYNGEKYLAEQIDSILKQNYSGKINLIIRNDGSNDNTFTILNTLKDPRIRIIKDDRKALGAALNFKELMKYSQADYIFFSDQDDIWLPDKISKTVLAAEKSLNSERPGLVYTNALVVDSQLASQNKSTYSNNGNNTSLSALLFFNGGLQGCSMLINRRLKEMALAYNGYWFMHDQVVSFIASCFGEIIYIPEKLLLYRQHANNVLGYSGKSFAEIVFKTKNKHYINYILDERSVSFIKDFQTHFYDQLTQKEKDLFKGFFQYINANLSQSVWLILKNKFSLRGNILALIIKTILYKKISLSKKV